MFFPKGSALASGPVTCYESPPLSSAASHPPVENLEPYTSTVDARRAGELLCGARRAVVLTHAKPDGDAVGSSVAATLALRKLGVEAEAWYVGPFPAWLEFMLAGVPHKKLGSAENLPKASDFDLIVIVDTGSYAQLDLLAPWLTGCQERVLIIDHHISGNAVIGKHRHIQAADASCTQVLAPVLSAALTAGGQALDLPIATALYLGLATDTGWFRFSNTTANTFRLAADLFAIGVNAPALYEMIEQQNKPGRPKLCGRALSSLVYSQDYRYARMSLTQDDFAWAGAESEDAGGFADGPLSVSTVQVVAILTEQTKGNSIDPVTKVSLRSKPGKHPIDVAAVCGTLGGGGHARAAGVKVRMNLAEATAAVDKAVMAALAKQPRQE